FQRSEKVNFISVLGVISVLLTGGIGLLQLDPAYIAIKEAAVPAVIAVAVLLTHNTRFSLVRKLLLNEELVQTDKLAKALEAKQATEAFEAKLKFSTYLLASSFVLSAILNYVLAKWIVVSPAGTEAFNAEIGRMTALSFPVIALPCTIIMMGAVLYLFSQIGKLTGEDLDNFLAGSD
ncbi:MAG: MFS transporter, partial [Alkalimonas sp.]|nr:MFS transporter [Alkalimonas sp.]